MEESNYSFEELSKTECVNTNGGILSSIPTGSFIIYQIIKHRFVIFD